MAQTVWKTVWWLILKLNTLSAYYPAVTLFGIYPNKWKAYVHSKLCTGMLIPTSSRLMKLMRTKIPFTRLMNELLPYK